MRARVIKAWRTIYTDPLTFRAGDALSVGVRDTEWPGWVWCTNAAGRSGWAPEGAVEVRGEGCGVAVRDYTARELPMEVGDELTLETEEAGWYWAADRAGRTGWVPATHLELNPAPPPPDAGA